MKLSGVDDPFVEVAPGGICCVLESLGVVLVISITAPGTVGFIDGSELGRAGTWF